MSQRPARLRRAILLRRLASLLPIAVVGGFVLFDERADRFRHIIPILAIWAILGLVVLAPALIRAWKKTLVFTASTALMLVFVSYVLGPLILRHIVLPTYNLTVDHRPRPRPEYKNQDGVFPWNVPADDYTEADYVLFFTGDSMTRGERLMPFQAFPEKVQDLLAKGRPRHSVRAVNGGWDSSSPILQLRQLMQIGPRYKPDVIIQAFDMTDFHNDLHYDKRLRELKFRESTELSIFRAMYIRLSLLAGVDRLGAWLRNHFVPTARFESDDYDAPGDVPQLFAMLQSLEESQKDMELSWRTILRTHEFARSIGANYMLLVLPRWQQYNRDECPRCPRDPVDKSPFVGEPLRFFRERAATAPFPIVIPDEDFRASGVFPTTFDDDFHYNEAGHAVVAGAVARALIDAGWGPPAAQ